MERKREGARKKEGARAASFADGLSGAPRLVRRQAFLIGFTASRKPCARRCGCFAQSRAPMYNGAIV